MGPIRDEDTDWSVFEKQNTKTQEQADTNANAVGAPRTLTLGKLGLLIVTPFQPEDVLLEEMEFRRQCLPLLKSPLQQIAEDVKGLPPELARVAVTAAVELQSGHMGKGEPSQEMMATRLYEPEGCAFRVWLLARKAHPDITLAAVQAEITPQTVISVLADLWRAFKPEVIDPETGKKKEQPTGGNGPSLSGEPPGPGFTES